MINGLTAVLPDWVKAQGPESDVVVSTRARLARSVMRIAFPWAASADELGYIADQTRSAVPLLQGEFPAVRAVQIDDLTQDQRHELLDSHLASPEHIAGGIGRFVIGSPEGRLSIMVNEEDHLRIQTVLSGLAVEDAWHTVDKVDDIIAGVIAIAYDTRLGYLTASPSNLGTGLRISVMMHLAGQSMLHTLRETLRAAYDLGGSVRGVMGEGSAFIGDLYQVSNEATLGISEVEIVERVRAVAGYLLQREREARAEIAETQIGRIRGSATKALTSLQGNMSVTSAKAAALLSTVRLAHSLGLVQGCTLASLNELLAGMRIGAAEGYNSNVARGELTRRLLATAYISG